MTELVGYQRSGPIARLVMDDGKVNVMSAAMLKAVHQAFEQAERDKAVVLLTGRGEVLSAGFDLRVFAQGTASDIHEMVRLGAELVLRIMSFPMPVVTACNGHAPAMGAFLLLASDVRVGADGPFKIGLNEVTIGLTVPTFAIELARARLTPAYFSRTVLTGEMFAPSEAVTAGFLDRTVAAEQLLPTADAIAASLTKIDFAAHLATKKRARDTTIRAIRTAVDAEITLESYERRIAGRAAQQVAG